MSEVIITQSLEQLYAYWEGVNKEGSPVAPVAMQEIEIAAAAPDPLTEDEWVVYFDRLTGPEGCDFTEDPLAWNCVGGNDKSKSTKILKEMGQDEATIEAVHRLVDIFGGHCDCEIILNASGRVIDHG